MKPYEEVCFPSGILRWTRENNLYVCRLTEDQMNEIKEIHETPYTKTYSGGKPNYTQPIEREPTLDGWPLYSGLPPAKVQDERSFEEFAQGFAQGAQVIGIPKREWHELTDNEIAAIKAKYGFGVNIFSFTSAVRELETWLKERNNG